jgi:hypothetical protein
MTTIRAQFIGDKAVLPREELEQLLELARRSEEIDLQVEDEEPVLSIMRMADLGGAFDFWYEEGEAIYTEEDGEPI